MSSLARTSLTWLTVQGLDQARPLHPHTTSQRLYGHYTHARCSSGTRVCGSGMCRRRNGRCLLRRCGSRRVRLSVRWMHIRVSWNGRFCSREGSICSMRGCMCRTSLGGLCPTRVRESVFFSVRMNKLNKRWMLNMFGFGLGIWLVLYTGRKRKNGVRVFFV